MIANQVLTLASDWGYRLVKGWEVNANYNPKGMSVLLQMKGTLKLRRR